MLVNWLDNGHKTHIYIHILYTHTRQRNVCFLFCYGHIDSMPENRYLRHFPFKDISFAKMTMYLITMRKII